MVKLNESETSDNIWFSSSQNEMDINELLSILKIIHKRYGNVKVHGFCLDQESYYNIPFVSYGKTDKKVCIHL